VRRDAHQREVGELNDAPAVPDGVQNGLVGPVVGIVRAVRELALDAARGNSGEPSRLLL